MRLRNITGSREVIAASPYVVQEAVQLKCPGRWNEIFGNGNPVHIEIGMGKGKFIHTMAKEHPEINYVGIEKYSSVLLRAIQKMQREELPNLRFLRMEAENITAVFGPGEVDRIYLNFSDPWPKDRHAKRRLPSREFLARYNVILKKEGRLEFKTDNRELFDFAVGELEPAGWKAEIITYDLHNDEALVRGNVMTEYEEKFSAMGNPICKYVISAGDGARTS
ncbi:MAG: tRNA (guanosine(46)-N7)-methyltransferase TrmB [Blautia sp.]|nr:tRNA (guanosine(46)-N7)-methyltransferase TrmB [Blautia sp.]